MIYGWQTFAITLRGVCRMLVKYPRWNFLRKLSVIICFHKIINLSLTMLWIHLWISLVISRFQTEQFALIDTEYFDQNCPYTECLCVPYLSQNRFIVLTNSYTPHLTRYSWRDWVPIIWRISSQVFSSPGLQSAKLVPNKSQT